MTAFLCVPAAVQTFTQPRGEDQRSAEALLPSKFTGLMKSLLGNLPGHSGSKIEGSESAVQKSTSSAAATIVGKKCPANSVPTW